MPIFHVWNIFGFLQSSLVTNGALPFMSYFASERKILFLNWNQWMLAYQWRVRTMLHGVSEWEGRFQDVSRVLLCCASWEGQLRYFLIVDQLCWLCRPPVSNSMEHLKLCVRAGSTQGLSCSWYTYIHNIKLLKLRTQLIHTLSKLWFGACSVCVFSLSQQLWKLIRTHILYHLGLGWRY